MEAIVSLIIIGIVAGCISGLTGVGGGIIMIPLLVLFFRFSQFQAQGTAIAAMLPPIGIMAAFNYYNEGYINWKYAVIISCSFILGAFLGSKLAVNMNQKIIRVVFGTFLLIMGIKMIVGQK